MADIKISELPETTDLEGLYTIGTDKNNLSKKVSFNFLKDAANYANMQGDYAKEVGDSYGGKLTELESEVYEFSESAEYFPISASSTEDGSYVNYTNGSLGSSWGYQAIKFIIKGGIKMRIAGLSVTSGTVQGLAFYDANGKYISGVQRPIDFDSNLIVAQEVDIPNNAEYVLQTWLESKEEVCSCEITKLIASESKVAHLSEGVGLNTKSIETLKKVSFIPTPSENYDVLIGETHRSNYYINFTNGEEIYLWGTEIKKIIVKGYSSIVVSCITSSSPTARGYAFFDANGNYITGGQTMISSASNEVQPQTIEVPQGAEYILQSWLESALDFSCIGQLYEYSIPKEEYNAMLRSIFSYPTEKANLAEAKKDDFAITNFDGTIARVADNSYIEHGRLVLRTSKVSEGKYNVGGIEYIPKVENGERMMISANILFSKMRGMNQSFWLVSKIDGEVAKAFIEQHTKLQYNPSAVYKYEIDIVEHNYPHISNLTFHVWESLKGADNSVYKKSVKCVVDEGVLHNYSVAWTENDIVFMIDGDIKLLMPNHVVRSVPSVYMSQMVGNTFGSIDNSKDEWYTKYSSLIIRNDL